MLPDGLTLYNSFGPVVGALILVTWTWFQLKRGTLSDSLQEASELADDLHKVRNLLEELRETLAVIILIVQAMAEENPNINEQAVKTALEENGHEPDDFKLHPSRATFGLSEAEEDADDSAEVAD